MGFLPKKTKQGCTRPSPELLPKGAKLKESLTQKNPKVILIADDDESLLDYFTLILQKDFEVKTALNGDEAWNLFLKHKPDLVILDIVLPRIDGFTLISQIRAMSAVPIIAISGGQSHFAADASRTLGANIFLSKPFKGGLLKKNVMSFF